jgi:hypothetical protein
LISYFPSTGVLHLASPAFYKESPKRAHFIGRTSTHERLFVVRFSTPYPVYNRSLAQTALLLSGTKRNECRTKPKESPKPKR